MYSSLTQIYYINGHTDQWKVWDSMWEGLETRIEKHTGAGFSRDMWKYVNDYMLKANDMLDRAITNTFRVEDDAMKADVKHLHLMFNNIHNEYRTAIKGLVTDLNSKYIYYNNPWVPNNEEDYLKMLERESEMNVRNLLDHGITNLAHVKESIKDMDFVPIYKGYTLIDDGGPLYQAIRMIVCNPSLVPYTQQVLVEKCVGRYVEMAFKHMATASDEKIGMKVVSLPYSHMMRGEQANSLTYT